MGPSGIAYTCTAAQSSAVMSAGCSTVLLWGCQLWLPAHLSTEINKQWVTHGSIPIKLIWLLKQLKKNMIQTSFRALCVMVSTVVMGDIYLFLCLLLTKLLGVNQFSLCTVWSWYSKLHQFITTNTFFCLFITSTPTQNNIATRSEQFLKHHVALEAENVFTNSFT